MRNTWSIIFDKNKLQYHLENGKKEVSALEQKISRKYRSQELKILHVKPENHLDTDKRLDVITTSSKYIASNLMEMSDSISTDSDDV